MCLPLEWSFVKLAGRRRAWVGEKSDNVSVSRRVVVKVTIGVRRLRMSVSHKPFNGIVSPEKALSTPCPSVS